MKRSKPVGSLTAKAGTFALVAILAACGRSQAPNGGASGEPTPAAALVETASPTGPSPRLVSLTPSLTYIAQGLGLGPNLVGVSRWCGIDGVQIVGDMRPDIEGVIAARPDLILMAGYPSVVRDVAKLRAHGFSVLDVQMTTLADTRAAFQLLGERLDARPAASRLLADLDAAIVEARQGATARAEAARRRPRVLVAFEVSDGFVFSTGGDDHVGEILDITGADNVASGGPRTARLSMEKVLLLAPDVIIHTAASAKLPDDAAALAWWRSHADVPAVRTGRVFVWPNSNLATHGPRLGQAIRAVAKIVDQAAGAEP